MNGRTHPITGWTSLFAVAAVSTAGWRAEVFQHGWAGWTWISYFHWAVPAGVLLFVAWAAVFSGVRPFSRCLLFVVTTAAYAVVASWIAAGTLYSHFFTVFVGPPQNVSPLTVPGQRLMWYSLAIFLVYPAIPVGACAIVRGFGLRPTILHWILCIGLFLAATPLAILMLDVTHHEGGGHTINAIKSGFIIPLLMIGLGVPLLRLPWQKGDAKGQAQHQS
jgi:hypothetical protein